MRLLEWPDHFPEAYVWQNLPDYMKQFLNRDLFLEQLITRQNNYQLKVEGHLPSRVFYDTFSVIETGDWHSGQCVVVLRGQQHNFVLKPRSNDVTSRLSSIVAKSGLKSDFGLDIPNVYRHGDFWFQDYIKPGKLSAGISVNIGAIVALSLWGGIVDLHDENLISSDTAIHLIDVECAFHFSEGSSPVSQLIDSNLVAGIRPGLGSKEYINIDRSAVLKSALETLSLLFETSKEEIFSFVDALPLRRVLIATHAYMSFLRRRFTFGWNEEETRLRWMKLRESVFAPDQVVVSETESLCAWSIPLFFQIGGELFDCQGDRVGECMAPSKTMSQFHKQLREVGEVEKAVDHLCSFFQSRALEMKASVTAYGGSSHAWDTGAIAPDHGDGQAEHNRNADRSAQRP